MQMPKVQHSNNLELIIWLEDKTRYDYGKEWNTFEQWSQIRSLSKSKIDFIVSPFSLKAVEGYRTTCFYQASGEIENYLMLEKLSKTGPSLFRIQKLQRNK